MAQNHRLNVGRLIADLGGPAHVAEAIGVSRTTPYRWMKRNFMSSPTMEKLKDAFPALVLENYFTTTGA
jgi:DNA-binding phage protein